MFIKHYKTIFARASLVAVLITGLVSIRPVKAEIIDLGGVKGGDGPNLDYGTAISAAASPGKTGLFEQTSLLQYTTDGHLLRFASNKVFLAGLDHALTVEFKGGRNVTPIGIPASTEGRSRLPSLGRVTYPDVWNGIDVVYTSAGNSLVEATYLLQAGAKSADIRLSYNAPVDVLEDGTLRFAFETGYMTVSAPIAFQRIEGQRYPVDVHFTLHEGLVGFALGKYNPNYLLTIDPLYIWHTFYGASSGLQGGLDDGRAVTTDTNGNIYITGSSESTWNGPGNVAPLHGFSGNTDIVVIKLNSAGAYQWHTFYGALAMDYAYAISGDGNGNIYVAGTSISEWMGPESPVNPYSGANSEDIVILKLNSAGAYQWHTFHGSSDTSRSGARDYPYAIASDANGIYVAGYSEASWNAPGNKAPLNPHPGYIAIVVLKLFPLYGGCIWHTFYGSPSGTFGYAMTRDRDGNLYITGSSGNWNGPGNIPPLNAFSGTSSEIVVLKLNSAGAYQWHTFYGSSASSETGYGVTSDANGNVIVTGYSNGNWNGPNAIPPLNAYAGGSSYDIVVLKLNSAGAYQWHTFHGSTNPEIGYGITTDANGNVYVTGRSFSWNGPNDTPPLNASSGDYDIVLAKLNSEGVYQWHTYYGSFREDDGYALSRDEDGNIILVGKSYAPWNGPGAVAPLNPHKHTSTVNRPDIVIIKLDVTSPKVTIEQNASQPDPTNTTPILFDISFNEPVTGFDAADLDLSGSSMPGTLSSSIIQVAPYNNTVYRATISGMTGSGNVVISIPAGAAQDAAGNNSEASTSIDDLVAYMIPVPPTDTATVTPTAMPTATQTPTNPPTATQTPTNTHRPITWVVTNTKDSGAGSLRQAIVDAAEGDTIRFDPSLAGQTIELTSQLTITRNLIIDGSGLASPLTLSGGDTTRILQMLYLSQVTISDLMFTRGFSPTGPGGAIDLNGNTQLILKNSTFYQNRSSSSGGAVSVEAISAMTVINSVFDHNVAPGAGGAIYAEHGPINITESTFVGNLAMGDGGAIFGTTITLTDCTLSQNIAYDSGGAVFAAQPTVNNTVMYSNHASEGGAMVIPGNGHAAIVNSTITQNEASVTGGAVYTQGNAHTEISNSTFAGNSAPQGSEISARDIVDVVLSNTVLVCAPGNNGCIYQVGNAFVGGRNNIIDTGTVESFGLSELADNGGNTKTMALLLGSRLIDAGDDEICASAPVNGLDQRGVTRPQGNHCDIGAFEYVFPPTPTLTYTPTITPTFTLTVTQTPTFTPTLTATFTRTPTSTFTHTATLTPTATQTPTATSTSTSTLTATQTATPTATLTVTKTATSTATPTATSTPTATRTAIAIATSSAIPTATPTATSTSSPTATSTTTSTITATLTSTSTPTATRTPSNGASQINVSVGGTSQGSYLVGKSQNQEVIYAGLDAGPVRIVSGTDKIVASERVAYFDGTDWTSYSELMGLPIGQVATSYTFPWYNNADLNSQLRFGNVGTGTTTVTVTIGGVNRGSYTLLPNASQRVSYNGLNAGPVKVTSSGNVPIIASLRVAYNDGAAWTSFSELMGLPTSKLTTSYTFPWYNNVDINSQLRFGNVGTATTTVTVTVGGQWKGSYVLKPNESTRVSYPDLNAGPVKVTSSGNVPIIASLRIAYFDEGIHKWTDFSEMMGMPTSALSTNSSFPVYNNLDHNSQIRFGNVGTTTTTVTVTIGGVLKGTYTLLPNASQRVSFPVKDGPVVIQSSGNVPIIASLRVAYYDNVLKKWTSFSEMMGLPKEQLATSYLFPWYNDLNLDTQLRFGVP